MSTEATGFTPEQLAELGKELDPSRAKTDPQGNIQGTYLEAFDVIHRANEIFGYGGWSDSGHVYYEKEINAFCASVIVEAGGVRHEDFVCVPIRPKRNGEPGDPETPSKDAYTTAMKRALRKFGDQFGNSLYDKTSELHAQATSVAPARTAPRQDKGTTPSAPQTRNNGAAQHTTPMAGTPARWPVDVPQDAIPSDPICEFSGEPFTGFTSSTGRTYDPRTEAAYAYKDTGGFLVKKRYREQWQATLGDSGADFPEL